MSAYRQRYMIVRYPIASEKKLGNLSSNGRFVNAVPIHELLTAYYWSRIDANLVLLLGEYPYHFQQAILNRSDVEVLPSITSTKKLGSVVKKKDFWRALKANLRVDDSSTMDDILDIMEAKHGPMFGPIK